MINYELQGGKGVLLQPEGLLEVADFTSIANQIDSYLANHGKLHGVLFQATSFLGWKRGFA